MASYQSPFANKFRMNYSNKIRCCSSSFGKRSSSQIHKSIERSKAKIKNLSQINEYNQSTNYLNPKLKIKGLRIQQTTDDCKFREKISANCTQINTPLSTYDHIRCNSITPLNFSKENTNVSLNCPSFNKLNISNCQPVCCELPYCAPSLKSSIQVTKRIKLKYINRMASKIII